MPDWVPVPEEEQRRRIARICARETWLLDTAYGQWADIPLARVELVVALDSILAWHFRSFARKRERLAGWVADPDGPRVIVFRRAKEAERWIAGLNRG